MTTDTRGAAKLTATAFVGWVQVTAAAAGWHVEEHDSKAGFPTVVLVRGEQCIAAHVKASNSRGLTEAQQVWHDAFELVPGVEPAVWAPADMEAVFARLTQAVEVAA